MLSGFDTYTKMQFLSDVVDEVAFVRSNPTYDQTQNRPTQPLVSAATMPYSLTDNGFGHGGDYVRQPFTRG